MFHWCSYWRTWSRVISRDGFRIREVNLTPIPGCASSSWKMDVIPVVIREHSTDGGEFVDELPAEVVSQILENCGQDVFDRLMSVK